MAPQAPRGLFTFAYMALLLTQFMGFAQYQILQAVLPVLIITQGGDATLAGIVLAAHSLPSVTLRPPTGWIIDRFGADIVLLVAAALLAVSGFAYFLPGIGLLLLARLLHGTAWSAFSAAGYATLVDLAPVRRRVEASGFYNLMPGIAQTTMPAAAFALIGATGFFGGLVLSAACGVIAFAVVGFAMRRSGQSPRSAEHAPAAPAGTGLRRRVGQLMLERTALRPLGLEVMYSVVQPLFLAFAPVYALTIGVSLELMPIYFLTFGAVLIAARLVLGTRGDRYDRTSLIRAGVLTSFAALVLVAAWPGFESLIAAGALYAIATTLVSPTIMAATMDVAPAGRVGSAMATYSLGFPLATGGGAALWGVVIDAAGFGPSFVLAAAIHATLLSLLLVRGRRLFGRRERPD